MSLRNGKSKEVIGKGDRNFKDKKRMRHVKLIEN